MVDLTKYGVEPKSAHQKLAVKALGKQVRYIKDVPSVLGQALAACGQLPDIGGEAFTKLLRARLDGCKYGFTLRVGKRYVVGRPVVYPYITVGSREALVEVSEVVQTCIEDLGIAVSSVEIIAIGFFDDAGAHFVPGVSFYDLPMEELSKYLPPQHWRDHYGIASCGATDDCDFALPDDEACYD